MAILNVALLVSFIFVVYAEDLNENEKYLLYKIEQLQQHFERNITDQNKEINNLRDLVNKNSNACENGWFPYLDQKCIKVIEKKVTLDEGVKECLVLDKQANLLSIHSEYEMKFLSEHLSKYNDISDNAWIGLKFNTKAFVWLDGTDLDYQNWDEDAKKDGKLPCVQISLGKASLGKWKDETCDRKNLIVCQKKQSTITVVAIDLKNITKVVDIQQAKINEQKSELDILKKTTIPGQQGIINSLNAQINNLKANPVPIGFIYLELSGQPQPKSLWPNTEWQNVSPNYAGQFFRVEGGGAAGFGQIQEQQTRTMEFESGRCGQDGIEGPIGVTQDYFSRFVWTGGEGGDSRGLKVKHHNEEIRPRNQAIRIWRRIK